MWKTITHTHTVMKTKAHRSAAAAASDGDSLHFGGDQLADDWAKKSAFSSMPTEAQVKQRQQHDGLMKELIAWAADTAEMIPP